MNPTRIPFHLPYWARQGIRGTKGDRVQHELITVVRRDSIIRGEGGAWMIISEMTPGYARILPSVSGTEFCPKESTTNFRSQYVFGPSPRTMATRYLWCPCLRHCLLLWACMYVLIWAYASAETQHLVVRRRTVISVEKINCGLCHRCRTEAVRRRCVWRCAFWKILFQPTDTS